jgi:hypothetical protein
MKIKEKPEIKNIVFTSTFFKDLFDVFNSLIDIPVIREIKGGINGRTHELVKLINPANMLIKSVAPLIFI